MKIVKLKKASFFKAFGKSLNLVRPVDTFSDEEIEKLQHEIKIGLIEVLKTEEEIIAEQEKGKLIKEENEKAKVKAEEIANKQLEEAAILINKDEKETQNTEENIEENVENILGEEVKEEKRGRKKQ